MLPGGTDPLYRSALAGSHEPILRIEIWRANSSERLIDDLVYETGSVNASLGSRVSRNAVFTVNEDMYPHETDAILNPYNTEARIFRGIQFADGHRYEWPVFVGRVTDMTMQEESGQVAVQCSDHSYDIAAARFETPQNSLPGALVNNEFIRLVRAALPNATFGTSDLFAQKVPLLTWENERASALDEMATAVGAFWFALADGSFVLRRVPWTVAQAPVLSLFDGEGGTIFATTAVRSRAGVFNSITVIGERTDGTDPVSWTSRDENPNSVTYANGPFGVQNKLVRLRTPATSASAKAAADDYLRRTTALTESWRFACSPDAALELGDVLSLNVRGRTGIIQVVESFLMPLVAGDAMTVNCRAQSVDLLDEVPGFDDEAS